jgi:hypothetical protein
MFRSIRAAALFAAAFAASVTAAGAQTAPAPTATPITSTSFVTTVFQQSYRDAIDSRCPKARTGADAIAADPAAVSLNLVNATEKEFIDCSKLPRLPQARDQTMYMQLAAATCFYIIATRTRPPTKTTAAEYARQIANVLAPVEEKRQTGQGAGGSAGGGGSNAMTGYVSHNAVHVNETQDPDPLGSSYDPAVLRSEAGDLQNLIDDVLNGK